MMSRARSLRLAKSFVQRRNALCAPLLAAKKPFHTSLPSRAKPTLEEASSMPKSMGELSNEAIFQMCAMDVPEALSERVAREIMRVDQVEYDEAQTKLSEMTSDLKNNSNMYLPHKIGLITAGFSSVAALPMVFSKDLCIWFNEIFVTTDLPEARDMETWLEIGAWSWNWMEPPLGTFSFSLLCLQFARNQMINIGMTPYTEKKRLAHAKSVASKYPQYREHVVLEWAERNA